MVKIYRYVRGVWIILEYDPDKIKNKRRVFPLQKIAKYHKSRLLIYLLFLFLSNVLIYYIHGAESIYQYIIKYNFEAQKGLINGMLLSMVFIILEQFIMLKEKEYKRIGWNVGILAGVSGSFLISAMIIFNIYMAQ